MPDCVFCRITRGEVPSYTLYEDSDFVAFLDINPLNAGHTLIIPRRHYKWVWDVPNIGKYFEFADKVANAIRKAFEIEWVVMLVIGEAVPHAHIQLIPRFENDGHGSAIDFSLRRQMPEESMKEVSEIIRKKLVS